MHDELLHSGVTVAIIGLGVTGRAAVRYCLQRGAGVLVSDSRPESRLLAEDGAFLQETGVEWEAGGHSYAFLAKADLLLLSPGIPEDHPTLARLHREGKPLLGELAVAAPGLNMKVVAVTGTNGKTTVTSLIGELIRAAGKRVFVGGNIGMPVLDFLRQGADAEVAVLEVSSFQLLSAGEFTPDVGVLLNITPDHLDRHKTLAAYGDAKMNLFARQNDTQKAILCGDDPECVKRMANLGLRLQSFGSGQSCTARIERLQVHSQLSGHIYSLENTTLANPIGALNAAAAILAAESLGVGAAAIEAGLAGFTPGPHRLQNVGEIGGVCFIDDSKGTNTGAVIAALGQLATRAVLIAGGRDKGEDYSLLRQAVLEKARAVVVIGEAGPAIADALAGTVAIERATSMEEAVRIGYALARPGEAVLLSPACASFDMFTSYGHRGEVFTAAVNSLAREQAGRDTDGI